MASHAERPKYLYSLRQNVRSHVSKRSERQIWRLKTFRTSDLTSQNVQNVRSDVSEHVFFWLTFLFFLRLKSASRPQCFTNGRVTDTMCHERTCHGHNVSRTDVSRTQYVTATICHGHNVMNGRVTDKLCHGHIVSRTDVSRTQCVMNGRVTATMCHERTF
jgi:hypothetical protein